MEELQHQLGQHCSTHTQRLSPTLWVAELGGACAFVGGHNEGGLIALLLYMILGGSVHFTGTYVTEHFLV